MRSGARTLAGAVLGVALALGFAGCAGKRIENGVFYSPKGYDVTLPRDGWTVVREGRADLELRRDDDGVGMLANASCMTPVPRTSLEVLARHLLVGIKDRNVVTSEPFSLGGRQGWHAVVDGRNRTDDGEPLKVEAYVIRGARCVYDFLYVAPPAAFDRWQPDFRTVVTTLATR